MTYLLDANVFIQAKNDYYDMEVFSGFWDWILHANTHSNVFSIQSIKDELTNGNDSLANWAKSHQNLFINNNDDKTQQAYIDIVNHTQSIPNMKTGASVEFLKGADPWLIAKAITTNATIVTLEVLNLNNKKKILIPNICQFYKVRHINTFELLRELNAKFIMS